MAEVGNFPKNFLENFYVSVNMSAPARDNWNPCFTPVLAWQLLGQYFDKESSDYWVLNDKGKATFTCDEVTYPEQSDKKFAMLYGQIDDNYGIKLVNSRPNNDTFLQQKRLYFEMDVAWIPNSEPIADE